MTTHTNNGWEFDSHVDVYSHVLKRARSMQVWSRPSAQWVTERDWDLTECTGKENPPIPGAGHYTNLEAFKRNFPEFRR